MDDSPYVPEINRYFTETRVTIPNTAFDNNLRDGIQDAYEQLMAQFSELQHEEDRRNFATYYASFLSLKASLDRNMDNILYRQPQFLFERMEETFTQFITREWRELVLQTYGEEFLNDFAYRNALATGDLFPILATRKLLSPMKALSFLVNGIFLLPSSAFTHYTKQSIKYLITELSNILAGNDSFKKGALLALKIAIIVAVVGVALYLTFGLLPFAAIATLFAMPLICRTLSLLSSPVNKLFRPLAQYFHVSPAWFSALSAVAFPALVLGLIALTAFTGVLGILPFITIALAVCNLIATGKLIYDIYKIHKRLGIFLAITIGISALSGLFFPVPEASSMVSAIGNFLMELTNSALIYTAIRGIQNSKQEEDELCATLPLPQEPIPGEVEAATLLGYTNASTQSNRFFNTPKDAECLPAKGRSAWQQTCSFFGVEPHTKKQQINFTGSHQPTLITRSHQPILALTDEMQAPMLPAAS